MPVSSPTTAASKTPAIASQRAQYRPRWAATRGTAAGISRNSCCDRAMEPRDVCVDSAISTRFSQPVSQQTQSAPRRDSPDCRRSATTRHVHAQPPFLKPKAYRLPSDDLERVQGKQTPRSSWPASECYRWINKPRVSSEANISTRSKNQSFRILGDTGPGRPIPAATARDTRPSQAAQMALGYNAPGDGAGATGGRQPGKDRQEPIRKYTGGRAVAPNQTCGGLLRRAHGGGVRKNVPFGHLAVRICHCLITAVVRGLAASLLRPGALPIQIRHRSCFSIGLDMS